MERSGSGGCRRAVSRMLSIGGWRDEMKYFLRNKMRTVLIVTLVLGLTSVGIAQTRPSLRRRTPTRRAAVPLVPAGTDLKVRINNTVSSKDSRIGDRFTATVINPSRFDEAQLNGHVSSVQKSSKIKDL